ncbi:MAG: aminopeptidase [Candidatus Latescibacteria bacterium]|nr:aminopeptidase [Candidatus Latescibacterota bacterium]NIM22304.1 aminopeptidase [Candidatus Latescibacterota bacterium]NIM66133.1 aminopeptidase [Candidatus Latescibacterota bacterium]NIO02541.1 aminopeptidase [Candidatus Latescibacterota bacterium]NIO29455.1 aminopeptidase [Candidatus Latescibacterota bacterium]
MVSEKKLASAARVALTQCLGVKEGEKLLIVTNPEKRRIAEALFQEGEKLGADPILLFYPKGSINGEEPPNLVAEAMLKSDVIIAPTVTSLTHTQARRRACKAKARVATMPDISEDFFVRGLSADYNEIQRLSKKVQTLLDQAKVAHVTSPSRCNLYLDIRNKALVSDGNLKMPGSCSNLPTGESELAPKTANGILVADRCGKFITEPTKLEIKDGYIIKYEGNPSGRRFRKLVEACKQKDGNDNAAFIAEFAIGTNKSAKVTGLILEDEKVYGTCHIAFGDNTSYPGGRNPSTLHIDVIVFKPTITFDGRIIMKNGKLIV